MAVQNPYFTGYPAYAAYQGYPQVPQQYAQVPQATNQPSQTGFQYVHGIEGAYAFTMPVGVEKMLLWDDTENRFYVKGYDEMGKPKILADNDFQPHVDRTPAKEDKLDGSSYVTHDYLKKVLAELKEGKSQ